MNIINTCVPIPITELKQFFVDKTVVYNINYTSSTLKKTQFLTYLSNLDIPCTVVFDNDADKLELLAAYADSTVIVNVAVLELAMIDVLYEMLSGNHTHYADFITLNIDTLTQWASKISSLPLYNMHTIDTPEFKAFVEGYPLDATQSTNGINFVSLLKHAQCYELFEYIDQSLVKYYKGYFTEYMFKGSNMFQYWANANNPLFLLTYGISEQLFTPPDYITAITQPEQGPQDATSI